MQKYVLSTIMGVESLAKKEVERQGGKIEEVVDRLVTFSGGPEMIPRMNFWSRVGNKVYMLLAEEDNVDTFDKLFDIVNVYEPKTLVVSSFSNDAVHFTVEVTKEK